MHNFSESAATSSGTDTAGQAGLSGPSGGRGFEHQALIYGSEQEFVDAMLPFVRAGVEAGEPVLIATQRLNVESLREALGADAAATQLLAAEEWYETSAQTKVKFGEWVASNSGGGRVRLIGEPPWPLGSEAGIRDWARYESVLNVSFAGLPVSLVCPYDTRLLPPSIIEHAESTHPEVHAHDGVGTSSRFREPQEFCRQLDRELASRRDPPVVKLEYGRDQLVEVRRLARDEASRAGLSPKRVEEVMLAVDEVATNGLVHGERPAALRIWRDPGELVFEVCDRGGTLDDPLAGQFPPPGHRPGGWGLWLSRLMSDALEVYRAPGRTCVRIHASVP